MVSKVTATSSIKLPWLHRIGISFSLAPLLSRVSGLREGGLYSDIQRLRQMEARLPSVCGSRVTLTSTWSQ
jgi:hypothetical protein